MEFVIYADESVSKGDYYSNFYGGVLIKSVLLHLPWVNEPPSYSRLSLPHFG